MPCLRRWQLSPGPWLGWRGRLALCWVSALLLMAGAGCRSTDNFSRIVNEPAPLPAPVRASFGKVGILPPGTSAEFLFAQPPSPGQVMASRAAQTFGALLQTVASSAEPQDHAAHPHPEIPDRPQNLAQALTPKPPGPKQPDHPTSKAPAAQPEHSGFADQLGEEGSQILAGLLVIGAVSLVDGVAEALFLGESKAEIKKSELAIRQVLGEDPLPAGIETHLGQFASGKASRQLVALPQSVLSTATNDCRRALTRLGIDSLLTLRITKQGFVPTDDLNHTLYFVAEAQVVVTRLSDGKVLHAGCLDYQSRSRRFTEWGAKQAKSLRAELREAQQQMAAAILEQLFAPDSALP